MNGWFTDPREFGAFHATQFGRWLAIRHRRE